MQVAAHQHAIAHALPHAYYAANPQAFPEGTLEHLLRGEGDPNDPNHQHAVVGPTSLPESLQLLYGLMTNAVLLCSSAPSLCCCLRA